MKKMNFLLLLPTVGLAANAPLSLPERFSQEPNCLPASICLGDDVEIFDQAHFAAIELVALTDGGADMKVRDVFPNPKYPDVIDVRVSYGNGASVKAYRLQLSDDHWEIVEIAIERE